MVQTLQRYFYLKNNDWNENNNNSPIASNLRANQKQAIYTDINELVCVFKDVL